MTHSGADREWCPLDGQVKVITEDPLIEDVPRSGLKTGQHPMTTIDRSLLCFRFCRLNSATDH